MNLMGDCAECGRPLVSYADFARHGWVTIQVSWKVQARVHTLCRGRFLERDYDSRLEMALAVSGKDSAS